MTLSTYNFLWGILKLLIKEDLLPYLSEAKEVHSQLDALLDLLSEKKVKKINIDLMKGMEFQKIHDPMEPLFGYMEQVLVSLLQL